MNMSGIIGLVMCVYEHKWDYGISHVLCVYTNMSGIIGLVMCYVCV